MKKVRIIADDHVACTISLAKAFILSGCHVQYVYVTATASLNNLEGINIKATLKYGVNDLTEHLKGYIDDKSFTFIVYRYPRPFESVKFINKIANVFIKIHSYLYRKFWEEKFDLINVVGRYSSNMYIYLMDYFPIDKTLYSIHEVYNHFTKQIPDHPFINKLISNNYKIILHSQNSIFDWNYCFREYKSKIYNVNFGKCDSYNVCIQNPVVDENGYILFFGFFKAYKGLNNILEMLKKYEGSRSFRFVIAGAGTLPEVDDLSNFDNVCIINRYITNNELASLISNCRVVICPYNTVSQSGVVQTAYAFNKPVIAPNLLAFEEVIKNDITGLLYESGNVEDMYNKLIAIYENNELYDVMRYNISNLDIVLPEYSWSKIVEQYKYIVDVQG